METLTTMKSVSGLSRSRVLYCLPPANRGCCFSTRMSAAAADRNDASRLLADASHRAVGRRLDSLPSLTGTAQKELHPSPDPTDTGRPLGRGEKNVSTLQPKTSTGPIAPPGFSCRTRQHGMHMRVKLQKRADCKCRLVLASLPCTCRHHRLIATAVLVQLTGHFCRLLFTLRR